MALDLPTKRVRRCVPPVPGMTPEVDLRLAEFGVVGGDDEVAHHGQLAAAAEREAGHRGDHRLAARVATRSQFADEVARDRRRRRSSPPSP